jgi:hypothetical protein
LRRGSSIVWTFINLTLGTGQMTSAARRAQSQLATLSRRATDYFISDILAPQTGALPNNSWFASSIIFTASSTTHAIGFGPHSVSGQNAFLGIDGIGIAPVPEPTSALLGAAAAALLVFARFKRGRQ